MARHGRMEAVRRRRRGRSEGRWIQGAIQQPGALRRTAKRLGLVRGEEPLSQDDLDALAARARRQGNPTLLRRVNLARTLRRLARRRKEA